jgi:hypothetical protein
MAIGKIITTSPVAPKNRRFVELCKSLILHKLADCDEMKQEGVEISALIVDGFSWPISSKSSSNFQMYGLNFCWQWPMAT